MTILCAPSAHAGPGLLTSLGGEARVVDQLPGVLRALSDRPDEILVVLGPTVDSAEALAFAAAQRRQNPALGVILVRDRIDVVTLTEALRAGVREVVQSGDLDGLADACRRSRELSQLMAAQPAGSGGSGGTIVTVFSAKGGCGKTTLATNLAVAL